MDLTAALAQAIEKICGTPASTVTESTALASLGIDSLAIAEIIVELEIRLQCELPIHILRRLDRIETVGDVVRELSSAGITASATGS